MTGKAFETGVAWIDGDPWLKAIVNPIAGNDSCGLAADSFEEYEDIESEFLKRGTLAHADIRWRWLGDETAKMLNRHSKDLRLLTILIYALPHTSERPALPLALSLVAEFSNAWIKNSHPRTKIKAKHAERIITGLHELIPKTGSIFEEAHVFEACKTLSQACGDSFAEFAPDLGIALMGIPAKLDGLLRPKPTAQNQSHNGKPSQNADGQSEDEGITTPFLRADKLQLNTENERNLKQSLSVVADFLFQLDIAHPLSYRLRRFATWYGITAPPPIKSGTRCVLQPVSDETVERYKSPIERMSIDHDITQRLERTCHLQPFWFEGQYLSYQMAQVSGRQEVAQAIRSEAARFAQLVPQVRQIQFSDGSPIISENIAHWLQTAGLENVESGQQSDTNEEQQPLKLARNFAKSGDMPKALATLDSARSAAKGLRAKTIWEVIILECLSDWGLKTHASAQGKRISDAISTLSLNEWEPELLKRIGNLK